MKLRSLITLFVCLGCGEDGATGDGGPTTSGHPTEGSTSSSTTSDPTTETVESSGIATTGESTSSGESSSTDEGAESTGSSGSTEESGSGEASGSTSESSTESTGAACVEQPASSDWSCLPADDGPAFGTGSALVHVIVQDFLAIPIAGATVRVCSPDDGSCVAPLDEATTDAAGDAPVDVPRDISVFYDIVAPDYVPLLVFPWDPPPEDDDEVALIVPTPTLEHLTLVFENAGVDPDPARGHLSVTAFDCSVGPTFAAAVAVDVSTADAATITGDPTMEGGNGGVYVGNVPPGPATVHGSVVPLCDAPMGAHAIHVRAGTVSVVDLFPSPTP